mmetsp:Transcript_121726/g.378922  ORF Transcript_121726/g.378922 Transcript_121726/m.378922 type:complete len:327 (-) Transcript_121726:15-995(-)
MQLREDGHERGEVLLRAQWRPLATVKTLGQAMASSPEENCWSLGKKESAAWVLFVGVYAATLLPPAPQGTRHWVTLSVDDQASRAELAKAETVVGRSRTPVQKDIDQLCRLGLSTEAMADTLECDVARVQRYLKRRSQSSDPCKPPSDASSRSLVDVEWDAPALMLLESVASAELVGTVWREGGPDEGFSLSRMFSPTSPVGGAKRLKRHALGSMRLGLGELLNSHRFSLMQEFPLEGSADARSAAASLKLRMQIRPLLPPPAADSSLAHRRSLRRKSTARGILPMVARPTVLGRVCSKEAALFGDFLTPDHSEDSDSKSSSSASR